MTIEELVRFYKQEFDVRQYLTKQGIQRSRKNLDEKDLLFTLTHLDEREAFYKAYHDAESTEQQVRLLESLDVDMLLKYGMQFPRYNLMAFTDNYPETLLFTCQHDFDVMLTKHPNYSPVITHAHDFYEAVYLMEGEFAHNIENEQKRMVKGDLCIISPGVAHSLEVFSDSAIVINILIRRSTFADIFFNLLRGSNILSYYFLSTIYSKEPNNYILFHTGDSMALQNMILNMMLESLNRDKYYSGILNSSLITFFAHLLRQYGEDYELPPSISQQDMQPYKLIGYIQDHYKTASLHDVAQCLHFSEEYTSRLIKRTTGKTYTELLLDIRMKRAAELLTTTSITISALCEEIGLLTPEHFIRTFKKYYGQTPTQYRRSNALIHTL